MDTILYFYCILLKIFKEFKKGQSQTNVLSFLSPLLQVSWAQVTRQPKGITVCWTRSRLCVGPVRTLQPSAATRYVSLFLAQAPEHPVSTCSRCLTTLRETAGATPPKVKIISQRGIHEVSPCIFKYVCSTFAYLHYMCTYMDVTGWAQHSWQLSFADSVTLCIALWLCVMNAAFCSHVGVGFPAFNYNYSSQLW